MTTSYKVAVLFHRCLYATDRIRTPQCNNGKWRYQSWLITIDAYSYSCTAVWVESVVADFSVYACNSGYGPTVRGRIASTK